MRVDLVHDVVRDARAVNQACDDVIGRERDTSLRARLVQDLARGPRLRDDLGGRTRAAMSKTSWLPPTA
jgi:hypothetical protein